MGSEGNAVPLRLPGKPGIVTGAIDDVEEMGRLAPIGAHEIGRVRHVSGLGAAGTLGKRIGPKDTSGSLAPKKAVSGRDIQCSPNV